MIPPEPWAHLPFFARDWPALAARLAAAPPWFPAPGDVFRALDLCPPSAVRVVILGQDPYPTGGRATGLAFGYPPGVRPTYSLAAILDRLAADTGTRRPDGDLTGWARQGVLLLNTLLTVPEGQAGGHRGWGWEGLTGEVLAALDPAPRAFLLWGRDARDAALPRLTPGRHLMLVASHPSGMSRLRPLGDAPAFADARPFSAVNAWLTARGEPPIDWAA
jgi:uracil-DNA glycosylase